MSDANLSSVKPSVSPLYNPRVRGFVYQSVLLVALVILLWSAFDNAAANMRARGIPTDFSFWNKVSGFDVSQTLIDYSAISTYGKAFWVGLLNTLLVAIIGCVLTTILGFLIGIARLSNNFVVAKLATFYVEIIRNTPLLLQLLFWYNAVLSPLPNPRNSIAIPGLGFAIPGLLALVVAVIAGGLGLLLVTRARRATNSPWLMVGGSLLTVIGLAISLLRRQRAALRIRARQRRPQLARPARRVPQQPRHDPARACVRGRARASSASRSFSGILGALVFRFAARKHQAATGEQWPVGLVTLALVVGLPLVVWLVTGRPISFAHPELRGFNFAGGIRILPEFVALLLGLTLYTASFIAEIVRAGIMSVAKGQTEAAHALGLRSGPTLSLVVIPQAMRLIIPPLTSQYLNLTKNSSLAVFIGYPDLVQIFAGTVLNQTGAAVQVIAITMAVYLVISLITSFAMNIYNSRMSLKER